MNLYQGDFLEQDLYEQWTLLIREHLRLDYLDILDHQSRLFFLQGQYDASIQTGQRILERDRCREDIHCLIMRSYARLGQISQALRQFNLCQEVLRADLDTETSAVTIALSEQIRAHKDV